MRYIFVICFLFSINILQAQQPKRIKIILLGTFHFNQSLDSNSRLHSNLFTPKRQKEIDDIVAKLTSYHPDKIFIERVPGEQLFWDSLYKNFQKGIEPAAIRTKANEIVQLGFKTARKTKLDRVICVDFQPENYADSNFKANTSTEKIIKQLWDTLSAFNDTITNNGAFFSKPYQGKRLKQDSLLQSGTLSKYLIEINKPEHFAYYTYIDWNWFYGLGKKDEYSGVDFVTNYWYGRNLRIYTNILRTVDYAKDKTYVLIYGSSHIPFIKHLFETNPYFEIVEVKDVLR